MTIARRPLAALCVLGTVVVWAWVACACRPEARPQDGSVFDEQDATRVVDIFCAEIPGSVFVVLAPFYADRTRLEFTRQSLAKRAGVDPGSISLAGLWVINYRDDGGEAFVLSTDEALIEGRGPSGEFSDLSSSQIGDGSAAEDPVIRSLAYLGPEQRIVPDGKAVSVLLWFPRLSLAEVEEVSLRWEAGSVPMRPLQVSYQVWTQFRQTLEKSQLIGNVETAGR